MTLIDAALDFARTGWPVFPCLPRSKQPAVQGGFHAATTNPETIKRFWRIADRNIGIPTGEGAGFWVLDVDGEAGEAALLILEREQGPLPPTREVTTGNGRHVWFHCAAPIPSSAGRIGTGLDARADRAYIIAPPSIHPSGRAYAWRSGTELLAPAPQWLIRLARAKPVPTISERALASISLPNRRPGCYGLAALNAEVAALAAAAPGSRNCALNLAAFRLYQLVAGTELDGDAVAERLIDACHVNGLIADDGLRSVIATIRSGRRAGLQCPRRRRGAT